MGTVQKLAVGLVAIGLVTAATLPERKTADVLRALFGGLRDNFATVITGKK